jgi:hypothetical protein
VSSSRLVGRVAGPDAKWPSLLTGKWTFPLVYLLPDLDGMTTGNAPRMDTAALAAAWSHVADGKISSIQVTFDPRPLTSGAGG